MLELPTVSNDFGTKTGETQDNQVECGSICADGDADNPGAYSTWACIMSDRDGDGITDIGCDGANDSTNSADPDNTADLVSCGIPSP